MELDGKEINVKEGDTVLIEDGVFHKVHAGPEGCYFVCVFDGKDHTKFYLSIPIVLK